MEISDKKIRGVAFLFPACNQRKSRLAFFLFFAYSLTHDSVLIHADATHSRP